MTSLIDGHFLDQVGGAVQPPDLADLPLPRPLYPSPRKTSGIDGMSIVVPDAIEQTSSLMNLVAPTRCNQTLARPLSDHEQQAMIEAAALKIAELLDILHIDHANDHNTLGTPMRVAKMMVRDINGGRFAAEPSITDFDNVDESEDLIVTGPIDVRSMCAHHMMPIYGKAFIGIVPSAQGRIIGLSKYDRVVQHFSARFQIQEELTSQIGRFLVDKTSPAGLAVRISAVHMCKTHRGVHAGHDSRMVTTFFHGVFDQDRDLRREFLDECRMIETAR